MYGVDDIVNLTGFQTQDNLRQDLIYIWLVPSLSQSERNEFDQAFANPDEFIQRTKDAHDDDEAHELPGYENIGNTHLAYTYKLVSLLESQGTLRSEHVIVRRGPVLIELKYHYRDGDQPLLNTIELARILDDRVAAVVGTGGVAFRSSGPLVPELTTYIPTPLDVSPRPEVIGTNLLLAALMMLPFAVAAELFTRTLSENEDILRRRFKPVEWLNHLQQRLEKGMGSRLRRPALADIGKLLGVMLFYGLVFSLLDRSWNPFSLQGLMLFLSMTIAYGVVGIADDIIQWRTLKKWGLPAELTIRPTNALLAVASTATSRLLSMVPGLMFGTPEALRMDEETLDKEKKNRLLKISAVTFIVIGLVVWLPTIITTILQRLILPETARDLLGGLEAFLLVIFAVAMENMFVQMLGFPGGFGRVLKQKNRWLWLGALVGVAFLFYHTLINPRGELAEAISQANVILFFVITGIFVIVSLIIYLYFRGERWRAVAKGELPPSAVGEEEKVKAVPAPAIAEAPTPVAMVAVPTMAETPAATGETKNCPSCGQAIKLEARICRFCHAEFEVKARGYCLNCHDVVDVEKGNCARCGNEAADVHFESTFLKTPPRPAPPPVSTAPSARKSHSGLWIAGALVVVVICGMIALGLWTQRLSLPAFSGLFATSTPTVTPTQPPTLTPTITLTSTPSNTLTPTGTPLPDWAINFSEPILLAIQDRPPDFQDDFHDKSGGWFLYGCSDWRMQFVAGELVMTNCEARNERLKYTDFVLEVDARFVSYDPADGRWGVSWGNEIIINNWGEISWLLREGPKVVDSGNAYPATASNHILIVVKRIESAVYVNDQPLSYIVSDTIQWRDISLFVPRLDNTKYETVVAFDNFKLWDISDLP